MADTKKNTHSYFKPSISKKKAKKHSTADTVGQSKENLYDKSAMAGKAVKVPNKSMFGRRSGTR